MSGGPSALESTGRESDARSEPPIARDLHDRRKAFHRAARGRIDRRVVSQLIDRGLQRGNLLGELTGCLAIAGVLDLQRGIRSLQLLDGGARAPARAEANQNRKRIERGDRASTGHSATVKRRIAPFRRSAMTKEYRLPSIGLGLSARKKRNCNTGTHVRPNKYGRAGQAGRPIAARAMAPAKQPVNGQRLSHRRNRIGK